jgi:hypothetical protein
MQLVHYVNDEMLDAFDMDELEIYMLKFASTLMTRTSGGKRCKRSSAWEKHSTR